MSSTSRGASQEEWDEDEWEWEEEEEAEKEDVAKDEEGKAQITITENLVTIDRSKVDWSDDEYEDDEEDSPASVPPPPPPPPAPPAPPPPPPGPPGPGISSAKSEKLEQLKKKPAKRPDWNDLMKEIGQFRSGTRGILNKAQTNDRSKPMLSKTKVKGVFVYESEKESKNEDILKEISKGIKLKHVRSNDRSKPCLKGIKSFKRQATKEEKLGKGFSFGEDDDVGEFEDTDKLKDDLEATKQLLELEVRSKSLLEKDNKRLQAEIEKLKIQFANVKAGDGQAPPDILNNILTRERKESFSKERRESLNEKRKSIADTTINNTDIIENNHEAEHVPEQVLEELDELKEEAEEAKKLAEEWEIKYKEMQRQMEMLDGAGGMFSKKTSTADRPSLQRLQSTNSDGAEELTNNRASMALGDDNDDDWMQKREISQLQMKLKNMKDKKEIIVRERKFLNERIDNLKDCIAKEFEARKTLKKDIRDMNSAFMEEMDDMEHDDQIKRSLEDCWYDESDLVDNPYAKKEAEEEEDEEADEFADLLEKDDDMEENIEEILQSAEECEELEDDTGARLFDKFIANEESDNEDEEPDADDFNKMSEHLNKKIEHQHENVKLMRQSNFGLKSKIDILYDILQTQKEKHYDLKQELNRMLSDV